MKQHVIKFGCQFASCYKRNIAFTLGFEIHVLEETFVLAFTHVIPLNCS